MNVIIELLKPLWLQILKYGGMAFAALFLLFKVRQSGKESEQRKQAMETLKGVKIRDKIENTILTTPDDKLDKLRKKWTRS